MPLLGNPTPHTYKARRQLFSRRRWLATNARRASEGEVMKSLLFAILAFVLVALANSFIDRMLDPVWQLIAPTQHECPSSELPAGE